MQQRGRKSTAALSVVAGSIDGRPNAPGELTKTQAQVWDRVVANEAQDWFKTAALQQMLAAYCRHIATSAELEKLLTAAMLPGSIYTLEDADRLLRMREREVRAAVQIATKLRMTNQSRWTAEKAGTAARKAGAELKPWQMAG